MLDLARLDDASFDFVEKKLADFTRMTRSSDLKAKGVDLLLSMAELDTISLSFRANAAGDALYHSSDEGTASKASNLLLDLARQEGTPLDKIAEAAKYKFRVPGSSEIQNVAGNLLLELVRLDASLASDVVNVISNTLSNSNTNDSLDRVSGFLLNLADLEGLSLGDRVVAAGNVFIYGRVEDRVSQAIDQLSLLLDSDPADTDEIKKIIEILIFVVPVDFVGYPPGEALKDKSLTFLVDKVLRNDAFANESETLTTIANAVFSSLSGQEADPRFQAAQAIQLLLLADPNEVDNPFTIYSAAKEKNELLNGVDSASIELLIPASKDGYKLKGTYLQMTMPVPDSEDMPKTSYEELKELQEHLRNALSAASLEVKKRLLQPGGNEDEVPDNEVDEDIETMLKSFDKAIDSALLKGWMMPQAGRKFNRVAYELQSIVEMIHKDIKAWEEGDNVHGEELSVPAANIIQLMLNITTCPSGKSAGVRLSAEQNGVTSPKSDEILREQFSSSLNAFLGSQEESALTAHTEVMELIEEAYDVYQTFKSNLIDGDSDFIQNMTASNPVSQPSHQHDYAFHVLGNVLGLMVEGEVVPVDLYGGVVHENLRNASGEDMLKACLSQTVGANNITDALVERFSNHWWNHIKEGVTQVGSTSGDANQSQKRYENFIKFVEAMGLPINEVFDYEEDEDYNMTFIGLKPEAVALMLEHLGILKKAD